MIEGQLLDGLPVKVLSILPYSWKFRRQPHVRFIKHFLQHTVQLFPITFAGITI